MQKFVIIELDQEREIYVNLISSPAGRYLSRRPYVIGLIKELMAQQDIKGDQVVIERDMGRNIGTTDIVDTSDTDTIYYAMPIKSTTFSRFARNRYPQQSNTLTVVARQDPEGNYEVCDTWIGSYCPAFPGDQQESLESKQYWQTHALVHDAQAIQSKSVTKNCPY